MHLPPTPGRAACSPHPPTFAPSLPAPALEQKLNKNKKGGKKKYDIFTKKEWYDVKAPAYFKVRDVGKAVVSKTQGQKLAADGLKGRVYDVCLADLNDDESAHRKIKLLVEDVQGKRLLTNFHGASCLPPPPSRARRRSALLRRASFCFRSGHEVEQ